MNCVSVYVRGEREGGGGEGWKSETEKERRSGAET